MEYVPTQPNRLAMGIAASAAAAGVFLAPTGAFAAGESTDGHTTHARPQDNQGYGFEPGFAMPDLYGPAVTATVVHTKLPLQHHTMPFAPEFSESHGSLIVDPADINLVTERLGELTGRFLGNVKVEIQGSASGEDSHIADDAGLSRPSVANVELANDRASHFAVQLEDVLSHSDSSRFKHAQVTTKPGVEQVLTKDEVADLSDFAHGHGYPSVRSMVVDFNDGHANHAATERLNDLLVPERGVRITVSGDMPVLLPVRVYEDAKSQGEPQKVAVKKTSQPFIKDIMAEVNGLVSTDLLVGTSIAAIAIGFRRRREEDNPKVVPLTVPAIRPQNPDEFDIVAGK
jgi:hypothetical protein